MGYTHYWSFNKPKGIKAADLEDKYQRAIKECDKVCKVYNALQEEFLADKFLTRLNR